MTFADALGWLIRDVVRQAMGMTDGSVRPANQAAPTGAADEEFATVLLTSVDSIGLPEINEELIQDDAANLWWNLDSQYEVEASVQFFKAKNTDVQVDSEGIPEHSDAAFDKAIRLPDRLLLPTIRTLLNRYGIGYIGSRGPARNISALVDSAVWESRGQVDLRFAVMNREQLKIAIINAVNATLRLASPGGQVGTTAIEVTT